MQSLAEVNVPLTGCEGFPAEGAAGFVLVICIFLSRILLNLQKQNFSSNSIPNSNTPPGCAARDSQFASVVPCCFGSFVAAWSILIILRAIELMQPEIQC